MTVVVAVLATIGFLSIVCAVVVLAIIANDRGGEAAPDQRPEDLSWAWTDDERGADR